MYILIMCFVNVLLVDVSVKFKQSFSALKASSRLCFGFRSCIPALLCSF